MSSHGEGMQVAPVTPTLIQCSTEYVQPWRGDAGRSRHPNTHPVQYYAFFGRMQVAPVTPTSILGLCLMHTVIRQSCVLISSTIDFNGAVLSQSMMHYCSSKSIC